MGVTFSHAIISLYEINTGFPGIFDCRDEYNESDAD